MGASENKGLRGAERSAWLFIRKLHSSTTEEELADYLEEKGISGNKTVEDLQSKGPNKAFRLAVPLDFLEQVNEPGFWPKGLIVRRWRFRTEREFAGDQIRLHQ